MRKAVIRFKSIEFDIPSGLATGNVELILISQGNRKGIAPTGCLAYDLICSSLPVVPFENFRSETEAARLKFGTV